MQHQLIEQLGILHIKCKSRQVFQQELNKLDQASKQLMVNAEKKCRRIKSGRIPFSPEAAIWIRQCQVYRSLLRYHTGKIRNRGNLKRMARRCGIMNCLSIPKEELLQHVKVCVIPCNYFQRHGKQYCQKHLLKCLNNAKDSKDEQRETEILAIIQREKDRSFWCRLNYPMGKLQSGLVCRVLVENEDQEGTLTEYSTRESIQQAIFENIHLRRFCLAEAAPICLGCL